MVRSKISRRGALALGVAGLLWGRGGASLATATGTRIGPDLSEVYVPPSDLATIADVYRRMTAPVMINGKGPFAFVVDTGANQTVISDAVAAQLGLRLGASQALNGVAGITDAATTRADLEIGGRLDRDVPLAILPQDGIGGAGLLGLDRLDRRTLTLDFGRAELRIARRESRAANDISVHAHRRDGQLTLLDADLAGIRLTAFLDSGAQSTIGNMALREKALLRNPKNLMSRIPILSATGQTIEADIADLPALHMGGMRLPNWPVAFADLHTFQMWNLIERPAILVGVDIMSRFQQVSLDFEHDEVRFRLPHNA